MTYLSQMIEALKLASPILLASRFDDGLGHCLEASIGGAGALSRRGIEARVLPCAVVVQSAGAGRCWSAGLSPSQIYALLPSSKPAFEEFRRASFGSNFDDEHPLHVVIEARHAGERAIIDLTIGQLRSGGAPVPFQLDARVAPDGGWVELTGDGLIITYMDSPSLDHLPPAAKPDQFAGFVADLHDGMSLALQCQLNSRRFLDELRSQFPQDMLTWERRIAGWMTIP